MSTFKEVYINDKYCFKQIENKKEYGNIIYKEFV